MDKQLLRYILKDTDKSVLEMLSRTEDEFKTNTIVLETDTIYAPFHETYEYKKYKYKW